MSDIFANTESSNDGEQDIRNRVLFPCRASLAVLESIFFRSAILRLPSVGRA